MYGILHGQCTILVEFPLPYSCSRYICLCEAIPYSSHQFSVNFMHHCFACCGVTMGEYGRGCSATTVHSSYTARAAVDLQCTLHYIACTLHLGLGMESQLSKSTPTAQEAFLVEWMDWGQTFNPSCEEFKVPKVLYTVCIGLSQPFHQ